MQNKVQVIKWKTIKKCWTVNITIRYASREVKDPGRFPGLGHDKQKSYNRARQVCQLLLTMLAKICGGHWNHHRQYLNTGMDRKSFVNASWQRVKNNAWGREWWLTKEEIRHRMRQSKPGGIHTIPLSSNISGKLSRSKGSPSFKKTARPCIWVKKSLSIKGRRSEKKCQNQTNRNYRLRKCLEIYYLSP